MWTSRQGRFVWLFKPVNHVWPATQSIQGGFRCLEPRDTDPNNRAAPSTRHEQKEVRLTAQLANQRGSTRVRVQMQSCLRIPRPSQQSRWSIYKTWTERSQADDTVSKSTRHCTRACPNEILSASIRTSAFCELAFHLWQSRAQPLEI